MLMQADVGAPVSAHVIVLGNEKGGSGKSTTAMHVAVALLQAGQRVATVDLDSRQRSFEVERSSHVSPKTMAMTSTRLMRCGARTSSPPTLKVRSVCGPAKPRMQVV